MFQYVYCGIDLTIWVLAIQVLALKHVLAVACFLGMLCTYAEVDPFPGYLLCEIRTLHLYHGDASRVYS